MIAKSIIIFLGAFLLLQGCSTAPFKDMDSALQVLIKRLELMHFAQAEHRDIDNEILRNGYMIMKKVLDDPKVQAEANTIQSVLDEIRSFVKHFEEYEKNGMKCIKQFQELTEEHDIVTDKYAETSDPPYSEAPKVVLLSFKENGYKKFDPNADPRVKEITKKFYDEVKKYYDGLTDKEKERELDIKEWLKEFEEETDTGRRDDLIWVFFGRIQLEKFLW